LVASNRLRTRYDAPTRQVLLQIDDVRPEDAGQYLVVAANPAGQDSTGGAVNIIPEKTGEETEDLVPRDKNRGLGQPLGKTPRPLKMVPGADFQPVGSQPEEKRPPRVLLPLKDGEIKETMPAVLTTTIDAGSPMATVRICVNAHVTHTNRVWSVIEQFWLIL
jgi:hypothetical protein